MRLEEWKAAPSDERDLGCSLLIVGAEARRGFVNRSSGYCLRHPDFIPQQFGKTPVSIGSGSNVGKYRDVLDKHPLLWLKMLAQFDLPRMGPLDPFGTIVGKTIDRHPQPRVSPHLHLCVIRCNDMRWSKNDRTLPNGVSWTMPPVETDYASFVKRCRSLGVAAEAALA
jgi:hypothetical protein